MIDYKFRENELIDEFKRYIDSTYAGHYGQGGLQSAEVIIDRGHGMGFFSGNVDKYNGRYGKKGAPEEHRKDILKIIHYGFLMLYEHDRLHTSIKKVNQKEYRASPPSDVNITSMNFRTSIDNATAEEWNEVAGKWLTDQHSKKQ